MRVVDGEGEAQGPLDHGRRLTAHRHEHVQGAHRRWGLADTAGSQAAEHHRRPRCGHVGDQLRAVEQATDRAGATECRRPPDQVDRTEHDDEPTGHRPQPSADRSSRRRARASTRRSLRRHPGPGHQRRQVVGNRHGSAGRRCVASHTCHLSRRSTYSATSRTNAFRAGPDKVSINALLPDGDSCPT